MGDSPAYECVLVVRARALERRRSLASTGVEHRPTVRARSSRRPGHGGLCSRRTRGNTTLAPANRLAGNSRVVADPGLEETNKGVVALFSVDNGVAKEARRERAAGLETHGSVLAGISGNHRWCENDSKSKRGHSRRLLVWHKMVGDVDCVGENRGARR